MQVLADPAWRWRQGRSLPQKRSVNWYHRLRPFHSGKPQKKRERNQIGHVINVLCEKPRQVGKAVIVQAMRKAAIGCESCDSPCYVKGSDRLRKAVIVCAMQKATIGCESCDSPCYAKGRDRLQKAGISRGHTRHIAPLTSIHTLANASDWKRKPVRRYLAA